MTIQSFIFFYFLLLTIQITLSDVLVYNNTNNQTYAKFDDEESSFDPSIPPEGITGYITTINPPGGCSTVDQPPNIPTFGYKWIALIPRATGGKDSCNFAIKVQNAYNANYSAVIVYNYDEQLLAMGPYGIDVKIPSVFVAHSSGLSLIKNYLYNVTSVNSTPIYHVKIVSDPPFKYGNYLIPFVSVIGISFFGLVGFMLVRCYFERRRTNRHRLPRSALKQLKIKKFVKTDPYEVCAICLDDYEEGAKLRILPCDHAYHMKCIDPWLLNNRRQCPVCKRYVFPNQDHSDEEENNNRQQASTPTEQTPLMNPNNDNSTIDISRNRQSPERQLLNPSDTGVSNVSFVSVELSDDEKDLSLSSGPATTAELVFERSSWNPRRYGSMNNSSTTSRNANFLVGSSGGTTDITNASRRSMADDISDFETNDERIHYIRDVPEENPAYVNDEESIDTNQTRL